METQAYIDHAEGTVLHTYNRFPVVMKKASGFWLTDTEGKEYLDFVSGIGVFALGHNHPGVNEAVKNQMDQLIHISNLYYSEPMVEAAAKLRDATGLDKVFFTNSGAEAVEGALKAARKYASKRDGFAGHEIISMNKSFHGRTMGAVSVTGTPAYRAPFEPLIGGVKFADFNDLESVKAQVTDQTCAIILEPIQGEGGFYPADPDFLQGIRKLCDENDILLILDEIQCGMGRTGSMYAYQQYGIEPDILTTAKALGGGLPIGAFVLNEKAAKGSLEAGDHGTTYGGNPLVCSAAGKVLDLYKELQVLEHVKEMSVYLEKKLDELVEEYDFIKERRGKGLMQGLEFGEKPAAEVSAKALENGLLIITAGSNVLRFLPSLLITEKEVDLMIEKLKMSF